MQRARVGVVGASGYSGAVFTRLVADHPELALAFATSDRKAGEPVMRTRSGADGLRFEKNPSPAATASLFFDRCDVVILATSARVSVELAPLYLAARKHVVDLSGAFRLAHAEDYERFYGFAHPAVSWLARAHYGLPEIFGAPPGAPAEAASEPTLIANPGCYPTASLLALAPLVRAGLVESSGIIVDAKSGVTGAGRQATEEFSFVEVEGDLRAYKLLAHQHTPEIARALTRLFASEARGASGDVRVTFTPHLLPVKRGLLATCYARPRAGAGATAKVVAECLADAYADARFVHACAPEHVTLNGVVGTNDARVGATADGDVVIALGAIDNLLKGAAGQAMQNLNLLYGNDESAGLDHLHGFSSYGLSP
jgi:N-acetyl-gamma-glutamyl-phosphate reductase